MVAVERNTRAESLGGERNRRDQRLFHAEIPLLTRASARAGIRKCRFHDLRHTFATNLVLAGVDLVTVKELMGHADIAMTMRYAHPTPESKRKAVELLAKADEVAHVVADGGFSEKPEVRDRLLKPLFN